MTTLEIILIAIGLAMDAFAVSISVGTTPYLGSKRARFRISFHFGLFQALMPVLGWLAGSSIVQYIKSFDHWIAFLLLAFVGGNMIRDYFDPETKEYNINPSKGWSLIMLSVATSIDALAVGLSLALIGTEIWYPAIIIGVITGGLSLLGIYLGKSIGEKIGRHIELVGGLVLIGIGVKIMIDHLFF